MKDIATEIRNEFDKVPISKGVQWKILLTKGGTTYDITDYNEDLSEISEEISPLESVLSKSDVSLRVINKDNFFFAPDGTGLFDTIEDIYCEIKMTFLDLAQELTVFYGYVDTTEIERSGAYIDFRVLSLVKRLEKYHPVVPEEFPYPYATGINGLRIVSGFAMREGWMIIKYQVRDEKRFLKIEDNEVEIQNGDFLATNGKPPYAPDWVRIYFRCEFSKLPKEDKEFKVCFKKKVTDSTITWEVAPPARYKSLKWISDKLMSYPGDVTARTFDYPTYLVFDQRSFSFADWYIDKRVDSAFRQ